MCNIATMSLWRRLAIVKPIINLLMPSVRIWQIVRVEDFQAFFPLFLVLNRMFVWAIVIVKFFHLFRCQALSGLIIYLLVKLEQRGVT